MRGRRQGDVNGGGSRTRKKDNGCTRQKSVAIKREEQGARFFDLFEGITIEKHNWNMRTYIVEKRRWNVAYEEHSEDLFNLEDVVNIMMTSFISRRPF